MTDDELKQAYTELRADVLEPIAGRLERHLHDLVGASPKRVDRISARAKTVKSFLDKAMKLDDKTGARKYGAPLDQIQDQIGARIIVYYLADVPRMAEVVTNYFRPLEAKDIAPETESEFGYFGKHFILHLPNEVYDEKIQKGAGPGVFELQVKTLFQHAWSEANHDLGYKPDSNLTPKDRRKLAFTSAQAWGADHMFNELHEEAEAKCGDRKA